MENYTSPVREAFEANVDFVRGYLVGKGIDMGCGSCPILLPDCIHVDISPQPLVFPQIADLENNSFVVEDATQFIPKPPLDYDYIFSSHMIEDLESLDAILRCLSVWSKILRTGGYIVLLMPDMLNGRHPSIEEDCNPSHRINVGPSLFKKASSGIYTQCGLIIESCDTIPHEFSDTFDLVLRKAVK